MFALDHASLLLTDLDKGIDYLSDKLGFLVTRTPENPARHARIMLYRTYIELAKYDEKNTGTGRFMWFIKPDDMDETVRFLGTAGINAKGPEIYEGEDGRWQDLFPEYPPVTKYLPVITRRITPVVTASEWPPPNRIMHPNGAVSLKGIYMLLDSEEEVEKIYEFAEKFTGLEQDRHPHRNIIFSRKAYTVKLPGGKRLTLGVKKEPEKEKNKPQIRSFIFGCESFTDTIDYFASKNIEMPGVENGVLYIKANLGKEVYLGFTKE